MLHNCERELDALDLVINVKKKVLLYTNSSNVICQRLCSVSGAFLPWSTEIKCVSSIAKINFKCSFKKASPGAAVGSCVAGGKAQFAVYVVVQTAE